MTDLEKYIKYHIDKEFKYHMMSESMGHIDDIDIYVDSISSKILNYLNKHSNLTLISLKNLIINKSDISNINSFFDRLILDGNIILDKTLYYGIPVSFGGYLPEVSGLDKNNNYVITIELNLSGSIDGISEYIKPLLAHELAHAYEDFCKNSQVHIENKYVEGDILSKDSIYKGMTSVNLFIQKLANVLYFCIPEEVNANKNEIHYELISKRFGIRNSAAANEILKTTETYKRLIVIEKYIDELKNVSDKIIQQSVIDYYNKIYKKSIEDYSKIINNIELKFLKARNKIITTAGNSLYLAWRGKDMIH